MQRERSLELVETSGTLSLYSRFEGGQRAIRPLVPLLNAAVDDFSLERCEDFVIAARRACETLNSLADPGVGPHHEGERDLYDAADAVACAAATVALAAELAESEGCLMYVDARLLPFEGGAESCAARLIRDLWKKWEGRDLLDRWEQEAKAEGGHDA